MNWSLELDEKSVALTDALELEQLLDSDAAQSAVSTTLKRIHARPPAKWERIIYPLLGLVVPQDEPRGTIELYLAGSRALIVCMKDDPGDGFIGLGREETAPGDVEFTPIAGEKFYEPARECIARVDAIAALLEFYSAGKRPRVITWKRRGAKVAGVKSGHKSQPSPMNDRATVTLSTTPRRPSSVPPRRRDSVLRSRRPPVDLLR